MMKKLVSLLLALVMALGLVVPVWGNDLPSGTEPLFFYGQDNKQEWHYFNGTGLGQGNSVGSIRMKEMTATRSSLALR